MIRLTTATGCREGQKILKRRELGKVTVLNIRLSTWAGQTRVVRMLGQLYLTMCESSSQRRVKVSFHTSYLVRTVETHGEI